MMHEKGQPIDDIVLRVQVQLDRRQECIMVIQQALKLINNGGDTEFDVNKQIELIDSLSKRSNTDLLQILLTCQEQLKKKNETIAVSIVRQHLCTDLPLMINEERRELLAKQGTFKRLFESLQQLRHTIGERSLYQVMQLSQAGLRKLVIQFHRTTEWITFVRKLCANLTLQITNTNLNLSQCLDGIKTL